MKIGRIITKAAIKYTKSFITNTENKTIILLNKINYMELVQDHIKTINQIKVWIVSKENNVECVVKNRTSKPINTNWNSPSMDM